MDDLVAINIVRKNGYRSIVVQRRAKAYEIVEALGCGAGRVIFRDVVGNPVVVDLGDVTDVHFLGVLNGPGLRDMLQPIPSGFDLAGQVPEIGAPAPAANGAVKPSSAADLDPIEEAMQGTAGSLWGGRK